MDCQELEANITDFLEGEADEASEQAALEHLATCEHCETVLAETKAVMSAAEEYGGEALDPTTRERLLKSIIGETQPHRAG